MPNVKNTMLDTLLSVIAPHLCCRCGASGTLFCDNCKYDIIKHKYDGCVICEKPTEKGVCNEHKSPYSQAWVVGIREGALQRLIDCYKFRYARSAAAELAHLLHMRIPPLPEGTIIVPIPTSRTHTRQRGYDHMYLIAKALASRRKLRCRKLIIKTASYTQHTANRAQRLLQSKRSFEVTGVIDSSKEYLLVDDVLTTGSTVHDAARALKSARAVTIRVAAIARQPLD
jgi:ComF family protein